jgi:hypothetical protein
MRKILLSVLISIVFSNASCDTVNSYLIKNDIEAVFAKNGLKVELLNCESQMRSRSGSCELKLSVDEATLVVEKLKMNPIESGNKDRELILAKKLSKCSESFATSNEVKLFKGQRTEIGNGSAFDTVNLFVNSQNNTSCLEFGYAYG